MSDFCYDCDMQITTTRKHRPGCPYVEIERLRAILAQASQLLSACGWKRDEDTGHPNQTRDGWLDQASPKGRLETSTEGACRTARIRTGWIADRLRREDE